MLSLDFLGKNVLYSIYTTFPKDTVMSKHILFIYPDFLEASKYVTTNPPNYSEGIASLSASLKAAGHSVSLYHLTYFPEKEQFIETVRRHAPDIIGFTLRTTIMDSASELIGWLDDELPEIPVMCGGYHPTLAPHDTLSRRGVDMICIGEGELQIVKLIDSWERLGKIDTTVQSFWFKQDDGTFIENKIAPYPMNLDELPFPDLDLFDFPKLAATIINTAEVVVSRGCLYSCTYCSAANVRNAYEDKKHYTRFRSPENAIQLLERVLKRQPTIQYLAFNDSILNVFPEWFDEFAELYKARIGKKFICNLRFNHMTEDSCRQLAEMGCYKVTIGLESGNEEFRRKYLKRSMKNDHMVNVSHWLKQNKIHVNTYNIVGLPHETLELSLETIKINAKMASDNTVVAIYYPYPGTRLMEIAEEGGFIDPTADLNANVHLVMPQYPQHQVRFARICFLPLMKKYRKIYQNNTPEVAAKKESRLDRKLLSPLYPHRLVYRYHLRKRKINRGLRTIAKRFMPTFYNKLRDRRYE